MFYQAQNEIILFRAGARVKRIRKYNWDNHSVSKQEIKHNN